MSADEAEWFSHGELFDDDSATADDGDAQPAVHNQAQNAAASRWATGDSSSSPPGSYAALMVTDVELVHGS